MFADAFHFDLVSAGGLGGAGDWEARGTGRRGATGTA